MQYKLKVYNYNLIIKNIFSFNNIIKKWIVKNI